MKDDETEGKSEKAKKKPEKEKSEEKELESLRKENSGLRKSAERNIYRTMIWNWVKLVLLGFVCVGIGFLAGWGGASANLSLPFIQQPTQAGIENIASDTFVATVTILGVLTGFVSVIGFFFTGQVKDNIKEMNEEMENKKKEGSDEKRKLIDYQKSLWYVILYNLRSGVLKYTRTYILTSMLGALFLILAYALFGASAVFIMIDFVLLFIILAGLFRIVDLALYSPELRLRQQVIATRIIESIEPE